MRTNKGGRPPTDSIRWQRNPATGASQWHVRVALPDGSRAFAPLDPAIPRDDEVRARACAADAARHIANSTEVDR